MLKQIFTAIITAVLAAQILPPMPETLELTRYTDLFDTITSEEPVDTISPQTVTVLSRDGDWLLIDAAGGEKWINPSKKPRKALLDVPVYDQRALGLRWGCEIVSVGMMINYTVDVPVSELVEKMPFSGDPHKGYVGEITGQTDAPPGFTIFPSALLPLTEEYLGAAVDMSGFDIELIKDKLARGKPVVVWVDLYNLEIHAVCLTGYDADGFYFNDPWRADKDRHISYADFMTAWDPAVLRYYPPKNKALSY